MVRQGFAVSDKKKNRDERKSFSGAADYQSVETAAHIS
jgi:hypothetical protein